ncbi:transposase family protein [Okeania sp. KiyG1]|uniref:transposase family protein n=1 Tax=Okeania sp. KiyG1 TaxID=2720165 RepID=UPI001F311B11|nr:transposase family protein [Okeania sp. KiyG1]
MKNFDKKQKFQGDKAYEGVERTTTPKRNQEKRNATRNQRRKSRKSQKRIFVEHVIRLIKIFGLARERFRLKDNNYQKVILTICGLVRLRIGSFILV